jgi:hypothetical protein
MQHSPIKTLSNHDLHQKIKTLAASERQLTLVVLQHLREVEARRLFCEHGYGSLLDYCVNELKYSESSAYRRIQSMRLLKEVPEAAKSVATGALTLSNLAKSQSVFRKLSEQNKPLPKSTKQQVIATLTNKTQKQAEEILTELHPLPVPKPTQKTLSSEKVLLRFAISAQAKKQLQEVEELSGLPHDLEKIFQLMLDRTLMTLRKQKGLSHRSRSVSDSCILPGGKDRQQELAKDSSKARAGGCEIKPAVLAKSFAKTTEPRGSFNTTEPRCSVKMTNPRGLISEQCDTAEVALSRKTSSTAEATTGLFLIEEPINSAAVFAKSVSANAITATKKINTAEEAFPLALHVSAENKRKYISVKLRKAIWQRADHQCEYKDPRSHRRCGQKRFLQIDHIKPLAKGGSDSFANLQLLCSAHNLWKSDR